MPVVRFRLLLVDDDADARHVLALCLETAFDVVAATDGVDAIAQLETGEFSAVLTDLSMPLVDGVAVVRWIETNRPALFPCTFVVTGGATTARQKRWLDTFDAARLFLKPIDPVTVIARIRARLSSG